MGGGKEIFNKYPSRRPFSPVIQYIKKGSRLLKLENIDHAEFFCKFND